MGSKNGSPIPMKVDTDDWPMMKDDLEKLRNDGIFECDYELENGRYLVTRKLMSRIILFEEDSYISKQLAQIIQDSFSNVKIKLVLSYDECLAEIQTLTPDILMAGANVSNCNCLDMIAEIRKKYPGIIIILITDYNIDEYRKEAILKGAHHIISMDIWTGTEILALINTILTTKTNKASIGNGELPMKEG